MPRDDPQASVLLVSPGDGDALADIVAAAGRVVERAANHRDLAASSAVLVIVDARYQPSRALVIARSLSAEVDERGAAMLVLVDDVETAAAAYQHGATHFLVSPIDDRKLEQALYYADRYVRRLRMSGVNSALVSAQAALVGSARWEWTVGSQEVMLSSALAAMVGQKSGVVAVEAVTRRIPSADRIRARNAVRRLLLSNISGDVEHEMNVDGRNRRVVHHIRPRHDEEGRLVGISATVEDADAMLLDRRLSAHFDPVSGLSNQRYAYAWVDQLLGGRSSADPACAVVLVAISRFEAINAGYGRAIGDAAIQAIGRSLRRLGEEFAPADGSLTARFGGAEFALAFAGPIDIDAIERFCRSIAKIFERPFLIGARVLHLSCRIGVATGDASIGSADALFRRATSAVSLAKRGEPNTWQVVLPGGADDAPTRAAGLQTDLRRALSTSNDEIEVVFQPQVEIATSRVIGVEALVRWRHPLLGPLSADTVIGTAEGAELMPRLGRHVMRLALSEAMTWQGALADLRVSVNVTAHDMRVPDFEEAVLAVIAETGFPMTRLTLEITESGLMENIERAAVMLARLRKRGISISIDDFGTGYSSLAYLKSLPVDTLKVDRALITDLSGTARDRVVVRGVVDMARSLGIGVVAEGVETHEQLELVVREGCNWFQGYLCSRPLSAEALRQFVPDWQARAAA